jgi:hypothetical protein
MPHRTPQTNEVLDATVGFFTKPKWTDLFSYKTRTTKRLLRLVLGLEAAAMRGDHIHGEARYLEIWFACVVPVMQGYWRSRRAERAKTEVLEAFHRRMLNIIFNSVFTPTKAFQKLGSEAQGLFHESTLDKITQDLHKRIDEYVNAMNAFFGRGRVPNPMPTELMELLIHNLFDGSDLPKKTCAEYADTNPQRFVEVLTQLATPMTVAYAECMKG